MSNNHYKKGDKVIPNAHGIECNPELKSVGICIVEKRIDFECISIRSLKDNKLVSMGFGYLHDKFNRAEKIKIKISDLL